MAVLKKEKLKVAVIGSRGLPPQYSGFETLVEYITKYLSCKLDITVFCSNEQRPKLSEYNNSRLIYLPFSANGWQSIIYDSLSILYANLTHDKILVLGCSNLVMSFMKKYRNKFILNIGGIEWKREKWGFFAAKIIKYSEGISVKNSACLIADNEGIKDYLLENYDRQSNMIEYGGDQVQFIAMKKDYIIKYPFITSKYILVVARIQSDNNIEMIINSFKGIKDYKMVIIGNWNFSQYGKKIKSIYKNENNFILLNAIYKQDELNVIRCNAKLYLHGHSAGGTNPSLVEAMYLGLPIFCFDNIFNRYTTENKANYFKTAEELHKMLNNLQMDQLKCIANDMKQIAQRRYKWEIITTKYYNLIIDNNY